jgi:hypothetical protein
MFVLRLRQPEYQSLNRLHTRPVDFTPPRHDARDVGHDGGHGHDRDGLLGTERVDEDWDQHDRRARTYNTAHSAGDEPDRQHEQEIHGLPEHHGRGSVSQIDFLGIRSFRAGFGVRSEWRWQLPRQSEGSIKTDSGTTRERRGAIPSDWLQGVACLDPDRPPDDVPRHRWRQFVGDCKNFLSSSENWANRAAGLGWDAMALFGCAPKRPLDYLGSAGLVWAINGGRLLELHRDWAVIDILSWPRGAVALRAGFVSTVIVAAYLLPRS